MSTEIYKPKAILSDVASLLIQNPTHEMMTSRLHGTYTLMRKYSMCRFSLNVTNSTENASARKYYNEIIFVLHYSAA